MIGYILIGPQKIYEDTTVRATALVLERLKMARAVFPEDLDADIVEPDYTAPEWLWWDENFGSYQCIGDLEFLEGKDDTWLWKFADGIVRNFVQLWHGDSPYRNVMTRDREDDRIIFTGDDTWGDSPEGGYAVVSLLGSWGWDVLELMGVS